MHLAAGLRWGCYSASPDPLATTIKGRGGLGIQRGRKGRMDGKEVRERLKGKVREDLTCPGPPVPSYATDDKTKTVVQ